MGVDRREQHSWHLHTALQKCLELLVEDKKELGTVPAMARLQHCWLLYNRVEESKQMGELEGDVDACNPLGHTTSFCTRLGLEPANVLGIASSQLALLAQLDIDSICQYMT